jgi:hypothetical protein
MYSWNWRRVSHCVNRDWMRRPTPTALP